MSNTVVIIPSRLKARRLPNKPLKTIMGVEMILHVYNLAKNSNIGEVLVATPDQDIAQLIKKNGGKAFISGKKHETGTDRIFEAFEKYFSSEPKIIINLQGDLPNLNPDALIQINKHMSNNLCDIATLASKIKNKDELIDKNVVKVITRDNIEKSGFSVALDFQRNLSNIENKFIYHHIGIYAFTNEALMRYVNLKRSKLELERNLEQMRALENKMKIHVGFVENCPLSVDTEEDLSEVKKIMEKNE